MYPQLKLKVRLTQSISEGSSSTVSIFGRQNSVRSQRRQDNDNGKAEVELPQPTPLTPQEEVLVKEVWNEWH
ncbi:hypothetical protein [Nostoc sp. CCY 9925]|uniref:hypothetical protein n=1 Tax=Nostoc sp. CCY 9925 TaxID=3103865 RepID=UPI0039C6C75F